MSEQVEVVESDELEEIEEVEEIVIPDSIATDAVVIAIAPQIVQGINAILDGNKLLIVEEDESGTGTREIDKAIKADVEKGNNLEEGEVPEYELADSIRNLWVEAESAKAVWKAAVEKARNEYRVNVLNEEAKEETPDFDKDVLKADLTDTRKVVMDAVTFLKSYAQGNNKGEIGKWAETLQIPQVGRKGVSSIGQKKPRVNVFLKVGEVDGEEQPEKMFGSFGEAAAFLSEADSTEDNKVKYVAGDVSAVWAEATQAEADKEFAFHSHTLFIRFKEKASDKK